VARIEACDAGEPRVDDRGDPFDGERRLGDVGREHDAAARRGAERALLRVQRQVAVERHDVAAVRSGERRDRLGGAPDLGRARQEDEHVPRLVEEPGERGCDAGGEGPRSGRRLVVLDLDREGAALGGEDGRVAEGARERVGLERRRHDDQAEVRTHRVLEVAHGGERDVALEVALVELVEDDDPHVLEERVDDQLAAENALGHEPEPRRRPAALLETHAVADLAANRAAALARHPLGRGACRDPPRLEDDDVTLACEAGVQDGGRHARRLAGTGRGAQHEARARAQRGGDLGEQRIDGERPHRTRMPGAAPNINPPRAGRSPPPSGCRGAGRRSPRAGSRSCAGAWWRPPRRAARRGRR
jgi:hypothetical protein